MSNSRRSWHRPRPCRSDCRRCNAAFGSEASQRRSKSSTPLRRQAAACTDRQTFRTGFWGPSHGKRCVVESSVSAVVNKIKKSALAHHSGLQEAPLATSLSARSATASKKMDKLIVLMKNNELCAKLAAKRERCSSNRFVIDANKIHSVTIPVDVYK